MAVSLINFVSIKNSLKVPGKARWGRSCCDSVEIVADKPTKKTGK